MYMCTKLSPPGEIYSVKLLGIRAAIVNKVIIIKKIEKIIIKFLFVGCSFFIENCHTYVFLDRLLIYQSIASSIPSDIMYLGS